MPLGFSCLLARYQQHWQQKLLAAGINFTGAARKFIAGY
jgi:hypothetical protein